MNLREAIIENQKQNKLFWLMRHCVTKTELEMREKKADEERRARNNNNKKKQNFNKTNKRK